MKEKNNDKKLLLGLDKAPELKKLEIRLKKQVNIFDILRISEEEIRHSNTLAWLLDANQSHGLGDFVIRRFFTEVTGKPGNRINYKNFRIYREWKNIDLLLIYENPNGKDKYIICVENKVNAAESKHQLTKYRTILQSEFPEKQGWKHYYRFLTIDGHESSQPEIWQSLSYEFFMNVIKDALSTYEFSLSSSAEGIIKQYLSIIERKVKGMDNETKELVETIYANHKDALQLIINNIDKSLTGKTSDEVMKWLEDNLPDNFYIDEEKTTKSYIRIRSRFMDKLFPDSEKVGSCWGNDSKYYYEISCGKTGRATVKLALSLPQLSESEKKIVDKMRKEGNSRGRSTSTYSCTVEVFIKDKQFIDEETKEFLGAEMLEEVFQQKIPTYERGIKIG